MREPTDDELDNVTWLETGWVPPVEEFVVSGAVRASTGEERRTRHHDHTFRTDELWAAAALAFVVLLAMAGMALAGGAR